MQHPDFIRIFRRESPVSVLGPGLRAVIWVQGCGFHCPGCIVPESWDPAGGEPIAIAELAEWVLEQPGIAGITLSGGEPFQQAGALAQLVETVRSQRDLGVMCYSGYRIEELEHYGTTAQRELLALTDLLVDGPYIRARHANLLWRGSNNQRLLALTARYRGLVDSLDACSDSCTGLSFQIGAEGISFIGVPPEVDFRQRFEAGLAQFGIVLGAGEGSDERLT